MGQRTQWNINQCIFGPSIIATSFKIKLDAVLTYRFLGPFPNLYISQAHRVLAVAVLMTVLLPVVVQASAVFRTPGWYAIRRGLPGFGVGVRPGSEG